MPKAADDPTTHYARRVVAGKIVACKWVRLACQRHLEDLRVGGARGLYFDEAAAARAIRFFGFLKHSKGEWAGSRFELAPWQCFIVGCLFGWKRADGMRRFRTGYCEVARKNGKTTLAAGIGLLLFAADGEPGAEVYTAATKRDQARIAHGEASRMVRRSPALRKRIRIYKDNLNVEETASKYEPLGADADTLDGLNPSGLIIDELHAHKSRDMVDVLETATGARRQPLTFYTTTAGFDFNTVWGDHHTYSKHVLDGTVDDDTWFAFIAKLDEGDDWRDAKAWRKANPNLGVSVKLDDLRLQCGRAQQMPAAQNAFKRLRCNLPTQQADRWIDLALWDAQAGVVDEAELHGCECYGGLDLSSVSDLTAWVLVFPHEDDPDEIDVVARFWCPEARLHDTSNRYRDQYAVWAQQGYLTVTPGNAIDYGFVRRQVLKDAETFGLQSLAVDRLFQGQQLAMELQDELGEERVVAMGMGFISMAAPMHEFHRRLLAGKVRHGGNPVLRWMADNVSVKQDAAGNLKMDKSTSQGKIDGQVALVMALDRLVRHEGGPSVYEDRGLRFA